MNRFVIAAHAGFDSRFQQGCRSSGRGATHNGDVDTQTEGLVPARKSGSPRSGESMKPMAQAMDYGTFT